MRPPFRYRDIEWKGLTGCLLLVALVTATVVTVACLIVKLIL
jgi:hypothetical protein